MGLHKEIDDSSNYSEINFDENEPDLEHKKEIRRQIEERLEKKRLKEELDVWDEHNWDEYDI